MIETTESGTMITGSDVLVYRTLSARRFLKMEIETGMKIDRRVNLITVANGITKGNAGTKRDAYAALDAYVVKELGVPSVPLKGK